MIFKKIRNLKIWVSTKNIRIPHILRTLAIFLVILRSNFFLDFLKELEVYIIYMDNDKVHKYTYAIISNLILDLIYLHAPRSLWNLPPYLLCTF